jgi:hypothetical protein
LCIGYKFRNEQSVTNKKEKIYGETHNDEVIKKKIRKTFATPPEGGQK